MSDRNLAAIPVMKSALVAIQELHKPVWTAEPFPGGYLCGFCDIMLLPDPCPTWMLADEGLGETK